MLDIGAGSVTNVHYGSQITQAGCGLEGPSIFSILFEGDFLKIGVPAGEEGALPIPSSVPLRRGDCQVHKGASLYSYRREDQNGPGADAFQSVPFPGRTCTASLSSSWVQFLSLISGIQDP